jgi:hypothetical protein
MALTAEDEEWLRTQLPILRRQAEEMLLRLDGMLARIAEKES